MNRRVDYLFELIVNLILSSMRRESAKMASLVFVSSTKDFTPANNLGNSL